MQGYELTGSTGFVFRIGVESDSATSEKCGMNWCDCGFSEPCLMGLHPGREVAAGIYDCLLTISRVCICSPHVVGDGVAAIRSIWLLTTAGTFN
jgi:hypothetical protein